MIKGFRDFVLRGNVIDLAVAVVIGAAFTAVVNSIVTNIFNPLIGALFQADSLDKVGLVEIPLIAGTATLSFGAVLGAVIQFLLVALVVYFAFVLPINRMRAIAEAHLTKDTPPAEQPAPAPTDIELLAEIRDLLKANSTPAP